MVGLSFFDDGLTRRVVLPGAGANEFPDIGIGEALEKAEVLDGAELLPQAVFAGYGIQILENDRQIRRQIEPHGVTLVGPLFQHPLDRVAETFGKIAAELRDWRRILLGDFLGDGGEAVGLERMPAGEQLIHHGAQGENIGAVVQRQFVDLFRRHVKR